LLDGATKLCLPLDPQPEEGCDADGNFLRFPFHDGGGVVAHMHIQTAARKFANRIAPHASGDVVYVQEDWQEVFGKDRSVVYAGGQGNMEFRLAHTMPEWASRLRLRITGVEVKRACDVSDADAIACGIGPFANSQTIDCDTESPKRLLHKQLGDKWCAVYTVERESDDTA